MRVMRKNACWAAVMGGLAQVAVAQEMPEVLPFEDSPPVAQAEDVLSPSMSLGLYPTDRFAELGACPTCEATRQARFYFFGDYAVAPRNGAVSFDGKLRAFEDLEQWTRTRQGVPSGELPSLVWVGSPHVIEGTLSEDGKVLTLDNGANVEFSLIRKIRTNLSYYDESSARFFANRRVVARGTLSDGTFVARTLWPADYALGHLEKADPMLPGEEVVSLVKSERGGARSPFAARVLWQRAPGQPLDVAGKPVLAFILNGAQGDDDESHGGHFAVATGVFGPNGEWNQWLVNNFYNLGSVSEKGIIASTVPMDAYLADLNSGQSWYRPSYMVVAVLKDGRSAQLYQEGIGRIFQHFYRQDFPYKHATANCTGLNIETLRTLGWAIPKLGAEGPLKAYAALPYMAVKEGSLAKGKGAFDYLATERTNLYPLVGFNTVTEDLLGRVTGNRVAKRGLERQLADDVEALVYVRIPQFPSSRAFGQAPVGSLDEYMAQAPENKDDWKIVPVGPRPFPPEMKDASAPEPEAPPSEGAALLEGGVLAGLVALLSLSALRAVFRKGSAEDAQ